MHAMGMTLRSRSILSSSPISTQKGRTGAGGLLFEGSARHIGPSAHLGKCLAHGRRRPSRSSEIEASSTGQQRPSPEIPATGNCCAFEEEGVGRVDFSNPRVMEVTALIMSCYEATFGKQMMPGMPDDLDPTEVAESLFLDPDVVIIAHDRCKLDNDTYTNVFTFANRNALRLFEYTWEEFTSLPSRGSAETTDSAQRSRNKVLAETLAKGHMDVNVDRISKTGKTLHLRNGLIFNLFDANGIYRGQTAVLPMADCSVTTPP